MFMILPVPGDRTPSALAPLQNRQHHVNRRWVLPRRGLVMQLHGMRASEAKHMQNK